MCNETKVVRDACCVEGANRSPKFLLKQFYVQLLQHLLKFQGPGMSRALPGKACISKLNRTILHVPCCMDGWFARAIAQTRHDYPGRIMYRICRPMYPPADFVVRNLVARAASRCDRLSVLRRAAGILAVVKGVEGLNLSGFIRWLSLLSYVRYHSTNYTVIFFVGTIRVT